MDLFEIENLLEDLMDEKSLEIKEKDAAILLASVLIEEEINFSVFNLDGGYLFEVGD